MRFSGVLCVASAPLPTPESPPPKRSTADVASIVHFATHGASRWCSVVVSAL
jgi:hypothetical protein